MTYRNKQFASLTHRRGPRMSTPTNRSRLAGDPA
jgi:hypothetical protein